MAGKNIVLRNLQTIARLGVSDDGMGLDYFIAAKDEVSYHDLPTAHVAGFIAVVIGASYYTKKLPVKKLQELCISLKHPVILLGGKEDIQEGIEIASVDETKIYNACGKFSLNQSADLIRKSKLVISHDTGLQYIACAFNKPVLARQWRKDNSPEKPRHPIAQSTLPARVSCRDRAAPDQERGGFVPDGTERYTAGR